MGEPQKKPGRRHGYYQNERNHVPIRYDIANDQPNDNNEKLLVTIIGVGDKVISYNKAGKIPTPRHPKRIKIKKRFHDWRNRSYNKNT